MPFLEISPRSVAAGNEIYVLNTYIRIGVNGFFLKLDGVEHPIFFDGHRGEYKFFKSNENDTDIVIYKVDNFVINLKMTTCNFHIVQGSYDRMESGNSLSFYDSSPPIPAENRDNISVDPLTGRITFLHNGQQVSQKHTLIRKTF